MTCYQHPNMPAAARCAHCGKEICAVCITHVNDQIVCRDCADVLRSQPAPVAAEPQPEAEAPVETPVQAEAPAAVTPEAPEAAPAPSAGEPSGMPVPIVPSSITPVARPAPPAKKVPDPGAGGQKAKEPLLSAALSLILPGIGQAYNGQIGKGLVLAAIYLGSGRHHHQRHDRCSAGSLAEQHGTFGVLLLSASVHRAHDRAGVRHLRRLQRGREDQQRTCS